jgi:hypothetical protein
MLPLTSRADLGQSIAAAGRCCRASCSTGLGTGVALLPRPLGLPGCDTTAATCRVGGGVVQTSGHRAPGTQSQLCEPAVSTRLEGRTPCLCGSQQLLQHNGGHLQQQAAAPGQLKRGVRHTTHTRTSGVPRNTSRFFLLPPPLAVAAVTPTGPGAALLQAACCSCLEAARCLQAAACRWGRVAPPQSARILALRASGCSGGWGLQCVS